MKVFKDGLCYVNANDLKRYPIPNYVSLDKVCYEEDDIAVFSDLPSIEYMKDREDIIDYKDVSDLSDEELDIKIEEAYKDLEPFAQRLMDTPIYYRRKLYLNEEFQKEYKVFEYIYKGLVDYKENRQNIDSHIISKVYSDSRSLVRKK